MMGFAERLLERVRLEVELGSNGWDGSDRWSSRIGGGAGAGVLAWNVSGERMDGTNILVCRVTKES